MRGSGLSLTDAARLALAERGPTCHNITVQEGVETYLRQRMKEIRPKTWEFYRKLLDSFAMLHGNLKVSEIAALHVSEWVNTYPDGSRPHARRGISAWLHFAADQQPPWLSIVPKMPKVASRERGKEIGFLTVDEAQIMLRGVPDALRSAIALQLFAGIRPEEITGEGKPALQWANINLAESIIRIPASVAKTKEPRLLEGLPECLWTWLTPSDGAVCAFQSLQVTRRAQLAAGFVSYKGSRLQRLKPWPSDAMRHTFATYHVAAYGNAAKTALLLGHRNQVMLYRHYRGLATKAQGEAFSR